jgi:two-component system, NtrC family, sensor kinase
MCGAMRLSVPLKVFLGFIAVMTAFTAVSVFQILRGQQVQQELRLLNKVYLRLNDVYRALDTRVTQLRSLQRNLKDFVKSGGPRSRRMLKRYLPITRRYRKQRLAEIRRIVSGGLQLDLPARDRDFLRNVTATATELERLFVHEDKLYDSVLSGKEPPAPPTRRVDRDRLTPGQQRLLRGMKKARVRLHRLRTHLRRALNHNLNARVRQTARQLEKSESRTLLIYVVLTLFAVLIAVAMMLMAHFTLRPLRVLREGSRRIGRGDYDHRVAIRAKDEIGELAAEFNSMAGAVQEREQRIIETERLAAKAERLATVGRAAAQITHEVRNPLSSIQLNAEMLVDELGEVETSPPVTEARTLLTAIQREIDRLTDVTEAYLQFARLPRPHMEEDELEPVLRDTVGFVQGEMAADGVTVTLEIAPLPAFVFDENLIRQALLNLLRNGREAMAADGGGTITLSAQKRDDVVEVVVADRGIGLEPDELKKVFDPFYSTKDTGTGLGLAITYQIIEEHGGVISAEQRSGGGTRFVFTLPMKGIAGP